MILPTDMDSFCIVQNQNIPLLLYFVIQVVDINAIPDGWMGLDIGPKSLDIFNKALADAKTVVWNGPMGVFEFPKFAKGTVVSTDMGGGGAGVQNTTAR